MISSFRGRLLRERERERETKTETERGSKKTRTIYIYIYVFRKGTERERDTARERCESRRRLLSLIRFRGKKNFYLARTHSQFLFSFFFSFSFFLSFFLSYFRFRLRLRFHRRSLFGSCLPKTTARCTYKHHAGAHATLSVAPQPPAVSGDVRGARVGPRDVERDVGERV